jgi:xanthine dehydrogenase YagS FAD-binding subunit
MRPFAYERPQDVAEALAAAGADATQARYLAGGTNLVDLMKLGVERPARLVDVSRLPMDAIEDLPDGGLRIGANVRNSDLAVSALVRERYSLLSQALLSGASGQLRNRATIAGNLLQRTRCAYFQDVSKPCNKRAPGSGCPAREGDHRNLAILGHSPSCVATHPSDMAVAMAAIGGEVHVLGARGTRTIPLGGLHRLPGDEPQRDTVLAPGDLITAVELSPLHFAGRSRYRKVRDRASFSFAVASLAAAVDVRNGTLRDCRLAFGGLAPVPWRALRAEELLRGAPATQASFAQAAEAELAQARPLRDNAFKVTLARNLLVRTLSELCEAA